MAADGTYKSAGTFETEVRALEVAEAAERHARLQLAETSPADKATVTLATYMEMFLSTADIETNSKETYARSRSMPWASPMSCRTAAGTSTAGSAGT
jgi:hypothetical protein